MRVLVINCGSSSIKSAVIDTLTGGRLSDIRVENIGKGTGRLQVNNATFEIGIQSSFEEANRILMSKVRAELESTGPVEAVAHRVVHGGARFTHPVLIDEQSLQGIEELCELAPLHNPPAVKAIRLAREQLADVPHVAVFDTAFHATLPARAREYALPRELTQRYGIRRFGFHGASHAHVASAVAAHLQTLPQDLRIISCHLGNGASVTAIEYGRSVETSMGMTPMEGLIMGSRAGDIDPGVLLHLLRTGELDAAGVDLLLNTQSGLLGLTGTQDMRDIEQRAAAGDEACRMAITLYSHRIRKYIGAYAAVMGGVDVVAFTGGVGENSTLVRHRCTQRLEFLGVVLDEDANRDVHFKDDTGIATISELQSRARIVVVRADEELTIAREAEKCLVAETGGKTRVRIPIAVSARHVHLSQSTIEGLFGSGHQLREESPLVQTGEFAAQETISLIGPRNRIDDVRVVGPARDHDQIEISRTDEFVLGIDAPVRISGDLRNTPGITLEGPAGRVTLSSGVISARRHIHMSPEDAQRFGVRDHDSVQVMIDSDDRDLVFKDVVVRVSPKFKLEMHLDTDEANAAGIKCGDVGEFVTNR